MIVGTTKEFSEMTETLTIEERKNGVRVRIERIHRGDHETTREVESIDVDANEWRRMLRGLGHIE
jgi:hypothetical protein